MRILAYIALALAGAISAGAQTKSYELKVGEFDELKVTDGINVDYRCNPDSAGLAVFTTTSDKASLLLFTPKKGRLEIQLGELDNPVPQDLPLVTVYSTTLAKVENAGDSLVRVFSPMAPAKFQAKLIGNGRLAIHGVSTGEAKASIMTGRGQIVIDGRCDKASFSITGTGTIQADGLSAKDISCRLIGTGTVGCSCTGRLSLHGAGSGKVYYLGTPLEISSNGIGLKALPME